MQVSIETTTGLERRLTVGVPSERIEREVNSRLQKAAGSAKIDGFRPGKVPMRVLRQRYGSGIRQEVIGEVMSQSFYEAVLKEELHPAGPPVIEPTEMDIGKDLQYVAIFEVYPDIVLGDLFTIQVEKPVAEVVEADIDKMVENLRQQQAIYETVDRAAADGDQVNIDYEGFIDGETFEGGSDQGSDLKLGSNKMIPGFEDGLIGLSAGDETTLQLTFPEAYQDAKLQGAAVEFKVKVNGVQEQQLAELDEAFFAHFGVGAVDEAGFREAVASNMARELNKAVVGKLKDQVMTQLLSMHDVQVPAASVTSEIKTLRKQMFQQFGQSVGELDDSILPDDLFRERAVSRVELGLILNELIKQNNIEADPAKVRIRVDEMAATYEDPASVVQHYYGNEELLKSIESAVLEEAIVDYVLTAATITEVAQTYEEALAPLPVPEPEEVDDESGGDGEEGEQEARASGTD